MAINEVVVVGYNEDPMAYNMLVSMNNALNRQNRQEVILQPFHVGKMERLP